MRLRTTMTVLAAIAVGWSSFAAAAATTPANKSAPAAHAATTTHTATTTGAAAHTGPWIDAQGKCRQANGQLAVATACKPPAATLAAGTAPKCVTGKLCGKSCIPKTAVCHQ
jgi:hypothetical protein